MPYISASIIIQLLTVVHPTWQKLRKKGSLVVVRSASTPVRYSGAGNIPVDRYCYRSAELPGMQGLVINPGFAFYFTAV